MAWDSKDIQRNALWALMRAFKIEGDKWLEKPPKKSVDAFRQAIKVEKIEEGRLASYFTDSDEPIGGFPYDSYLIFKPPLKDPNAVCAIHCNWDFGKAAPAFGGYLGIWTKRDAQEMGDGDAEREREIIFLGYRFETPNVQGTKHKYHHAQPCRSMDERKQALPGAIDHSVKLPAFHLPAEAAADLLINLALSVHGRDYLIEELLPDLMGLRHPRAPVDLIERIKGWPF